MNDQFDIKSALGYLKKYINTYDRLCDWDHYNEETWLNDILYGLGVSIDGSTFLNADGFEKFREHLFNFILDYNEEFLTDIVEEEKNG